MTTTKIKVENGEAIKTNEFIGVVRKITGDDVEAFGVLLKNLESVVKIIPIQELKTADFNEIKQMENMFRLTSEMLRNMIIKAYEIHFKNNKSS